MKENMPDIKYSYVLLIAGSLRIDSISFLDIFLFSFRLLHTSEYIHSWT